MRTDRWTALQLAPPEAPRPRPSISVSARSLTMAKPTISGPGRLDAMVANLAGDNITLLLGNGAGGFSAASNSPLSTGDMPERLVLGDINNDGLVDVVAANFGSDNVTVLLGNGFSTASG